MVAIKQKLPHLSDGNVDIEAWLQQTKSSHELNEIDLIIKAAHLSNTAGKGFTTFYGQPCVEQSLEMADIILDLKLDQEAVAAAMMSSIVEHTQLSLDTIKESLGENVAKLADGSHQIKVINTLLPNINKSRDKTQIDRLRKTFLAMVSDIRVVLIKLAEQLCIMRGIKNINLAERKRLAQETLDIYAPLANRLGIGQLKWELEDLAFHYTDPQKYKMIAKFLAERRVDRENRIHEVITRLKDELEKVHIKASISGRAKHIYSIFLKMQKKHLDYKNIYDASAVRVLVPTQNDCYNTLSRVHHLWEHIPEEFDDYIANPKSNGYRSIHTAVIGPEGKNLEIQIRTNDMHEEAEHGFAAHWLYKENKPKQSGYETKITFLRQLLSWHKDFAQEDNKPNKTPDAVFEDRVYVFTPAGDIFDLTKGATPLDFAYHIHGGLGNRCRGAKINGHIVPLTYQLHTGDRVEIITIPNGTPSRDWLNKTGYLNTSRARAKVSQWFRQQDIDQYIETGKQTLEREFTRAGIQHVDLQKVAALFNFKNANALLSTVGHGSIRPAQIVHAVQVQQHHEINKPTIPTHVKHTTTTEAGSVQIAGVNDLLTRIAKCCKPIPGDEIIGYITQGRGISIHRQDCTNVSHVSLEHDNKVLGVNWDNKHIGAYYVDLEIRAEGDKHLLKEITSILANAKVDLISMNTSINKKSYLLYILMTVQIHDKDQLNHLVSEIRKLPHVNAVKRVTEK